MTDFQKIWNETMGCGACEQQPSKDCISRQAVIEYITANYGFCHNLIDEIKAMPSVTPRTNLAETSQDCISRQAVLDIWHTTYSSVRIENEEIQYKKIAYELPSVYPERPKRKWIKIQSGDEDFPESIVCSRCKNENSHLDFDEHSVPIGKIFVTSKYCPNCGAEMSGGREDGNSN